MALRKGNNADYDEPFSYFWNEYHDIESTCTLPHNTEDEACKKEDYDKNETEIEWLRDVGFTNIAEKLRDHKRIDQNDEDMRMIASSLTRSQANAVRRRIDFLNDVIQQSQPEEISSASIPQIRKHKDVRDVFDSTSSELPGSRVRRMTDDSSKRHHHHHGQRQHAPKSSSSSDAVYKDVPLTVHQKVKVSSKISQSGSPVVAPKPKHAQSIKTTSERNKNEHRDDKSKRSENRNHSTTRSENGKGQPHPSNELGRHSPSSQLTFMTGVQRDRVISEKTKPNKPNRSTPKNNIKNQNSATTTRRKLPDPDEHYRRHSVPANPIDNKNSCRFTFDDEYSLGRSPLKYDKVEVDGGVCSNEISASDNVEVITHSYIDVDDDIFDVDTSKDNVSTAKSNGEMKTHNIKGINSSHKVPIQDYKVSLVTSQQNQSYQNQSKNNSISYTTSVQTVSHMSPSRTSTPYMIPSVAAQECISSAGPLNIFSQKDKKIKKTHSCSPLSYSPSSPGIDVVPAFSTDNNKLKKSITSVSLEYETDIVPLDSLSNSTSPKESRQCPDVDSKKYTDSSQTKMNTNHLRISDMNHNDFLYSGSEDSKSISSRESLGGSQDDLGKSVENDIGTDPTQINITMGDDSPELQTNQRPAADEDARLDVGPMITKEQPNVQCFPNLPKFPPLPNFNLSKDITGMTEVDDLSDVDMEKVRSIALIELTALFDAYQIPMNRKKPVLRPKFKDSGVFGVALTALSQREVNKKTEKASVPRVFKEILIFIERHGLNEEGVLRVPGASTRIKALREAIDKNANDLNLIKWDDRNVKDVSACLKQFLRDLPEPLLSYEYQNTFLSVEDLPDRKIQLQALNLLVILLKPIHQKTLKALLDTLKKIIDNEETNKMGLNNVAMIMAPNLLLTNGNKIEVEGQQKAQAMTDIMRMLIKYQSILWTIPSFMVGQIRCIYDSGVKTKDPKAVKKIIQKQGRIIAQGRGKPTRSSGSSGDELDHVEAIIRVKAPSLNKQSMAIKLINETTAGDVIAKFQWRRQNSQKEKDEIESTKFNIQGRTSIKGERKSIKYHLYEAGGNIGERRLEGSANITEILKVNPSAEWVLKGYEK